MEFYLAVFKLQDRCLTEAKESPCIDEEAAKERLEKSRPLLQPADIPIDPSLFKKTLQGLCELVSARSKHKTGLDRLLSDNELGPDKLERFLARTKQNDLTYLGGISNRAKVRKELVYFVVQGALAPFYRKAAEAVRGRFDLSSWSAGFCPVCGHRAAAAKWSGEGDLKVLECSLCGTPWQHPLSKCSFCGNDDPEKLLYLSSDKDRGHGLSVCQSCNKYLKISNEKELGREVILPVEQVVTVYLDQYAREEGYSPGTEYVEKVDKS